MVNTIKVKVKEASATSKLLMTTLSAIAIAWIGAWQTVSATNTPHTSLNDGQISQVRTLIKAESPITQGDKDLIVVELNQISTQLTNTRIEQQGDHVLLQQILKQTK